MDEFETYNVDEIENVINDDDIAEANPLPDENNNVQMNESSDNNHGMSRAKKKYTFEKEVNEKIAGTKHSLDTTDPREAIRVLNTGETKNRTQERDTYHCEIKQKIAIQVTICYKKW